MASITEIYDLKLPTLAPYVQLTGNQLRSRQSPENALFIAESEKVIAHGIENGMRPVSLLMEKRQLTSAPVAALLERLPDVPVYVGERELLSALTGYALTRGILCAMQRPKERDFREILQSSTRVAVLEGIVDPTNVGAIFRSAAALGMDGVLLSPTCCDPLHRRALRVSMGTVFQVPWGYIGRESKDWPEKGIREIKQKGFSLAALALKQDSLAVDATELKACERLAVLLGTEGDGLQEKTISLCDYTVLIPMARNVDSLNVAAAGAVAFWELSKTERQTKSKE